MNITIKTQPVPINQTIDNMDHFMSSPILSSEVVSNWNIIKNHINYLENQLQNLINESEHILDDGR